MDSFFCESVGCCVANGREVSFACMSVYMAYSCWSSVLEAGADSCDYCTGVRSGWELEEGFAGGIV